MAPKKKPAKEGEEDVYDNFLKKWKKNEKEYDTPKLAAMSQILQRIDDGEEDVKAKQWNFDAEFDTMSFRVLWQSLRQTNYPDIEAIRLWKCNGGDESVRSVCHYLEMEPEPQVKEVAFTDNGVTPLGCEFLGKLFGPTGNKIVNRLVLDYNKFGTPGIQKLSLGLSQNSFLRQLSLKYCGIGPDGGQYIAHILIFVRSALEVLELRGNDLGNEGVVDVFMGARRSKMLRHLDVFDNKFSDAPEVMRALRELFATNTTLAAYDLGANRISDDGATNLVKEMVEKGHSHLQSVLVTERCKAQTFEALDMQLSKGKGKKKKGKKK